MKRREQSGRSVLLSVSVAGATLLGGCTGWPHFDYAEGPPLEVVETEADGEEQAQNLRKLHSDVHITGLIEDSSYIESDQAPFGLPGWYYADVDYFQFSLSDPGGARLSLVWTDSSAILDLYFFSASSATGQLSLVDFVELSASPIALEVAGLEPGLVYVFAVAGREGEAVTYRLSLDLG